MKYCEQKFSIVTQDLKMSNILETVNRHKNQTMGKDGSLGHGRFGMPFNN